MREWSNANIQKFPKRNRYLIKESSVVTRPTCRLLLFTALTFTGGVLVGFNVKDLMLKACNQENDKCTLKANERQHRVGWNNGQYMANRRNDMEKFSGLPEKFLKNVTMGPPATTYLLRPWKILERIKSAPRNEYPPFLTVVLVKSAVPYALRRFLIRKTWGSMSAIEGNRIGVIFVIGMPKTQQEQKLLELENRVYGDIIQGDVSDAYKKLPSKVLSGYQFVVKNLANASEFYISSDDDCFLNIPNTFEYIRNLDSKDFHTLHCGFIYSEDSMRIPYEHSKWGIPDEVYPSRVFPPFCHGGMSILPYALLRDIYQISLVTNYTGFHLEDVLTNGILREKLQQGKNNVKPAVLHDRDRNRRLTLVWHLGYRKDRNSAVLSFWRSIQRKLAVYEGPYNRNYGYRATIQTLPTLRNKTMQETIQYFVSHFQRRLLT